MSKRRVMESDERLAGIFEKHLGCLDTGCPNRADVERLRERQRQIVKAYDDGLIDARDVVDDLRALAAD